MDIAIDILAFRIVSGLVIYVHQIIAVDCTNFDGTPHVVLSIAPRVITLEETSWLLTFGASW